MKSHVYTIIGKINIIVSYEVNWLWMREKVIFRDSNLAKNVRRVRMMIRRMVKEGVWVFM